MPDQSKRHAEIHVDQLDSGYWAASVRVQIPGLPDFTLDAANLHNAAEALDWARFHLENYVASV